MNYYIAKRANKEDKVSGHFWEARFKSQALLDIDAIFACMAYVDLNPIRANMYTSLRSSKNTSIKFRLEKAKDSSKVKLSPFRTRSNLIRRNRIFEMTLKEYTLHVEAFI